MSVIGVSLEYLDASEESGLIEAAQSGDREAFLRLVRQYRKPLYRAAYSMVRDAEKAEALTRDVFLRAWQRLHDFPRGQRFFPWLLRAARGLFPTPQVAPVVSTEAVSPAEAPASVESADEGLAGGEDAPGMGSDAAPPAPESGSDTTSAAHDSDVEATPTEAIALAAFAELRPDEQMALSLRLLERISYEDIGAILDLSLGVVTLRLSQARGHLLPRAEAVGAAVPPPEPA